MTDRNQNSAPSDPSKSASTGLPPTAVLRRRVLLFRGTRNELLTYLAGLVPADLWQRGDGLDETYEWELTAAISRHPAGKMLTAEMCGVIDRHGWACANSRGHGGDHRGYIFDSGVPGVDYYDGSAES